MTIKEYHAHLYYCEDTFEKACEIIEKAKDISAFTIGRMHKKNVGPHPKWSCQLLFANDDLPVVLPWLFENRDGLTVFMHPQSGDDKLDHTDHAIWLGEKVKLKLEHL